MSDDRPVPGEGEETPPARRDARAARKADKAYAKATRPWYRKKRFWLLGLLAVLVVAAIATSGGQGDQGGAPGAAQPATAQQEQGSAPESTASQAPTEKPVTVTADKLIKDLEANALKASSTYKGKRVVLTGAVSNVDASGDYIGLRGRDDFSLTNVQVFIGDEHLDVVTGLSEGDQVTVTGQVTEVGEVMGYSIDADTIK